MLLLLLSSVVSPVIRWSTVVSSMGFHPPRISSTDFRPPQCLFLSTLLCHNFCPQWSHPLQCCHLVVMILLSSGSSLVICWPPCHPMLLLSSLKVAFGHLISSSGRLPCLCTCLRSYSHPFRMPREPDYVTNEITILSTRLLENLRIKPFNYLTIWKLSV